MTDHHILWPVVGQITLTLWLYVVLVRRKKTAVSEGKVNEERRALYEDAWPDAVVQVNNAIRNQFELPVLFYALVLSLLNLGTISLAAHITAWLFFVCRLLHAFVHIGNNIVPIRRKLFTASFLFTVILLALVIYRLINPTS